MISNILGIWLPEDYINGNVENPIKRMSGNKNKEFEERFRLENADFLAEALESRPLVLTPACSI